MNIYIYTLSHPITNEVRYVGKTINIKRRYKQHLYDKRHSHKASWVKSLKNEGLKPVLTILETCQDNWQEREIFWISQYDNLTNLKQGGGVDYIRTTSDETKEKLRQANLGKILSDEHKNNLRKKSIKTPVVIDGVNYDSMMEASKILKIKIKTISRRVINPNNKTYSYLILK
jgi:group I intron endonuclease